MAQTTGNPNSPAKNRIVQAVLDADLKTEFDNFRVPGIKSDSAKGAYLIAEGMRSLSSKDNSQPSA